MAQNILDIKAFNASLEPLLEACKQLGMRGMPNTHRALAGASAYVEQTWVDFASGRAIPGTDRTVNNAEYRNSITRRMLNPFAYIVFVANDAVGDAVEEDRPRVDLKEHLPFKKSRFDKEGMPYSVIPFRHKRADISSALKGKKVEGQSLAQRIFRMEKSYVMGSYLDARGVKRFTYRWAAKDKAVEGTLRSHRKAEGRKSEIGRLAGVVRFETSTTKGKSSAYMTFRTISLNSSPDSWIIPERKGVPLSSIVYEETKDEVVKMILEGADQDLSILTGKRTPVIKTTGQ